MGRLGIKVWIYKGDVLPEAKETETVEASTTAQTPAAAVPAATPVASNPVETEGKGATT
jgi:small subunit ribosomal protein S3